MQFSFGRGLLRAALSLGFLACLIAQGSLFGAAATNEGLTVTTEAKADASGRTPDFLGIRLANLNRSASDALCFNCSDSTLANPVEIGLPEEFSVAVEDEDSIEMFRFDIQQRTFAVDRTMMGARASQKIARSTRLSISPPLLV